jgi:hypothetical protein
MPVYVKKKFKFKKEDVKPARSIMSSRYHIIYYFYSLFASKQKAVILNLLFSCSGGRREGPGNVSSVFWRRPVSLMKLLTGRTNI